MKTINPIQMITNDISFQTKDNKRFRLRAAALFIENNQVLFATNDTKDYYYPIGGAVELGETTEQAVVREVLEETGICAQIDRLAFVQENFFIRNDGTAKGLKCHEITFFFLMRPIEKSTLGGHSFISNNTIVEHTEWLPIDKLDAYDIYPDYLKQELKDLKPYPKHIIVKSKKR